MYHPRSEPVTFIRDCPAVLIPAGERVTIPAGSHGFLTQALGGSFTVYLEGNLFRLAGQDADAIGKEPTPAPEVPPNATAEQLEPIIWDQMRTCYDPEIPINIVDLGLIYECKLEPTGDGKWAVDIKMTLTAPGCGMGDILTEDVREKISIIPGIERVQVELVLDPPWNQSMMSEEARLEAGLLRQPSMKRLTLLRHAKSSWKDRSLRDRDRPLSERGERDAPKMGERLLARKARPSLIISSPAVRAVATARVIAHALNYPQEFLQIEPALYLAEPDTILSVVRRQDDGFTDIMLVGHNPGLTDLANRLMPHLGIASIPTAGVLAIDFAVDRWRDITTVEAVLQYFDYPKNPDLLLIEDP